MGRNPISGVDRSRPGVVTARGLRLSVGAASLAVSLAAGIIAMPIHAAGAAATTTTTKVAHGSTTTAGAGAGTSEADNWLRKAVGAEGKIGSVRIDGKIQQKSRTIYLDLVVNSDGEGGGTFVQNGFNIELERVGALLYFNAPKKYWQKTATAAQANRYGGKWLEISALDSRFISFDQFLDADDLVYAAFEGHAAPLAMGKPTTFQGHKVVVVKESVESAGKRATGSMFISATGKPVVYKIVNDSPGNQSTIVFSHYGKAVALTVPPNAINLT